MSFTFACPSCNVTHKADEKLAGRKVRCPKCKQAIVVPRPPQAATAAVAGAAEDQSQWRGAPSDAARPKTAMPPPDDEEPMNLSGEKTEMEESEMDMTPMVDVTFLLLIFFMVTAAFTLQKSIEIPKPKQDEASTAVQQEPEDDPEFVTVWVDEFNTYRVVTLDWDVEAPSEQELLRKLREARQGNSAGQIPTKLLVKAHGDALHEKVVAALDAGTEVGIEQVQLMTVEELE